MTKEDLTAWALANGWQMIAGAPSLTKPSAPKEAIVRLVFKATVANLEVKKPAGKWEKFGGEAYVKILLDEDDCRLMEPLLTQLDPEDWEDLSAYPEKP